MGFIVFILIICFIVYLIDYASFKGQIKEDIKGLRSELYAYQDSMYHYFSDYERNKWRTWTTGASTRNCARDDIWNTDAG